MNTTAVAPETVSEAQLIEQYLSQLSQLSPDGRLELLARLARTLQSAATAPRSILDFAGAWAAMPGTDEEIMTNIRAARTFSRLDISLD